MDTLVIGIDGGEWAVIDRLIEAGRLPHIAELRDEGVSGDLESVTPPVSPPAWNSILTGTNPGKHGVFDFSTFDEHYQRRSINASDRRSAPFWRVLNDHDVSTGLFKVPFTYPPEAVDGFVVTGFPTPDSVDDHVIPGSLVETVGPPEDLFEDWSLQQAGEYAVFRDDLIEVAEHQTDALLTVLERDDPEFVMSVYDGADRIQHFFWKHFDSTHSRYEAESALADAIPRYYEALDAGIGALLDRAGEGTNVLLLSDHGFGPLERDVYIDEWLERNGFLARKEESTAEGASKDTAATLLRHGWAGVQRAGLGDAVRSVVPEQLFRSGHEFVDAEDRTIQWRQTQAFFSTLSGQAIYINLDERFRDGGVSRGEYDAVVERLRSALLTLRDPETDRRVIEDIYRREDLFEGWAIEAAPDLIVRSAPRCTLKDGRSERLVRSATQSAHDRSGDHRTNGIVVAAGPAFDSGTIADATILDIAPTLCHLQGTPVPESMDGRVLESLFAGGGRERRSIERTSEYGRTQQEARAWSAEESTELEAQLEHMGYL